MIASSSSRRAKAAASVDSGGPILLGRFAPKPMDAVRIPFRVRELATGQEILHAQALCIEAAGKIS